MPHPHAHPRLFSATVFAGAAVLYGFAYLLALRLSMPGAWSLSTLLPIAAAGVAGSALVASWLGPHLTADTLSWWPSKTWGGPKSGLLITVGGYVLGAVLYVSGSAIHSCLTSTKTSNEGVMLGTPSVVEGLQFLIFVLVFGTPLVLVPALPFGAAAGWLLFRMHPPVED